MNTSAMPRNAMPSTMEHLGAWYAGHKFGSAFSYVTVNNYVTDEQGVCLAATFNVYNEVSTEIGKVMFDHAAAGDGWSFSAQCKARNASGSGRCQRIALDALCAHHQGWVAS